MKYPEGVVYADTLRPDSLRCERREKVGRRGDAIKLYKVRKTDALRGAKLPANMKHKGLRFKVVVQGAIDWYIEH